MPKMSELAIKAKELNYFSRKFWGRVKDYIDNQELKNVPVGTILAVAGDKIPEGFLPCNGASISRSTYQRLFEVIDTKYGIGNGSTTFNLPNIGSNIVSDVAIGDIPVVGNGLSLGMTTGTTNFGTVTFNIDGGARGYFRTNANSYGKNVGDTANIDAVPGNVVLGVTTDKSKSGIVAKMTATKINVKYIIKY